MIRKDSDYLAQNEEKGNKIWRLHKKSLSLQRESNRFTIQVSFLRGQAVYVTTHFIKAVQQSVRLCFLSKTIFRKPLLKAILRLTDTSLLPLYISTS